MNDQSERYAELLVHAQEEIFKDNPRHYFIEQLELIRQAKESVWSAISAGRAREATLGKAVDYWHQEAIRLQGELNKLKK